MCQRCFYSSLLQQICEMAGTRYLLVLLFITSAGAALELSCDHGEEFKPYNFTCDTRQSKNTQFSWRKGENIIDTCVLSPSTNYCEVESAYHEYYTSSVSGQILILTIISVNRINEGIYSCFYDGIAKNVTCDFKVYAKPENVSCQQPEYQLATGNVKVMCTATEIYPYPFCQFSWVQNVTTMSVTQNISYQNMSEQGQPPYYNPTCILSLPAQVMGFGSHVFSVRVYPNITGNTSNDIMYGKDSSMTSPVNISYPTIKLECLDNSRENYSLEGTTINCNCRETVNTFLSANTSISQGSIVQSSTTGYTTYNFTVSRNTTVVTCQAKVLNWISTNETYTPHVAYGPDIVSVKVMSNLAETSLIDLCGQTQPVVVTVYCTTSDARPGVVYGININGTRISPKLVNTSSLPYPVIKSGPLSVQCFGNNSVFTHVSITSQLLVLQVIEPPTAPPIIDKYQESGSLTAVTANLLTVQKGNNRIRCRVEGGYPSVSSLSLSCGDKTNTSVGNVVYVDVNVSRNMDASECSCTATHNSSCYRNNQTVIKLDVLFESEIVKFTANDNTSTIVVETNSSVRLSCEAEGNPSPSLSLRKDGQQLTDYSNSTQKFNLSLNFDKIITECKDAGVYSCQAVLGETAINKAVDVNVKCKNQLENSNIENKVYKVRVNGSTEISIPVYGYPEPTTLHLDSNTILDKKTYNLTYTNLRPSYGVVSLQIYTVTEVVFQSYRLKITNSEGSLDYNFQIIEGDPAPVHHRDGTEPLNIGAIAGGIAAGILVILVIVLIVVFLNRKGNLRKNKERDSNQILHEREVANETVVIENTLYGTNRESGGVVIFDNSGIYNEGKDELVVVDNSPLYNMGREELDKIRKDSEYKNYSEVTPTITSALTVPTNMKTKKEQYSTNDPYEDVEINKIKTETNGKSKPATATKPKPVPKPKPREQEPQKGKPTYQVTAVDQTYATVNKVDKPNKLSGKPHAVDEDENPYNPPEVPDKKYEKSDKELVNSKMKDSSYSNEVPSSSAYTNIGFTDLEDEKNVYANTKY